MAVDSQAKRMSCIGIALPVPSLLPVADSSVSAADRLHLSWLYAGITAAEPAAAAVVQSANVAIRLIASKVAAVRLTATENVAIRITASKEVDL